MNKHIVTLIAFIHIVCFAPNHCTAQILPLQQQAAVIDDITTNRLNNLLPQLMEQNSIEMWVLITREYNEDPIIKTMLPATWLNARRTTMLIFYNNTQTKEFKKMAIARYNVGKAITASWNMEKFPNQWDALVDVIKQFNPKNIAINTSESFAHADGLEATAYKTLVEILPSNFKNKLISSENLAVQWLETRTAQEMNIYPQLIHISKQIIAEGFSNKVITPGITTSEDLVWWYRQKINDMGLQTWFHPSVEIQRNDSAAFDQIKAFSSKGYDGKNVILPGDLLHVDFGITYLKLNTDIQEHAYVLFPNETAPPNFLKNALQIGNRLQDILTNAFSYKKTGNQILADALAQAKKENINATIYSHPLGLHGHAAGPTIGLWDMQNGVKGSGDFPLHYNTCYAIELNAAVYIKEWNKTIRIMLEQDAVFNTTGVQYFGGRQTKFHIIGNNYNN
jgi:Metallopeptidase family M24